jgi:acetyl-CoA carboxylase biotin carboxyl carrier protein
MVGTFYRAAQPGATAVRRCRRGRSRKAQTLCIIEAMKLHERDRSRQERARSKAILVENGQPVEFGQPLFVDRVRPRRPCSTRS